MKVALCLLTCERFEYTRRTVESLAAHNDLSRFVLLHGDDASQDGRNAAIASRHGFARIETGQQRLGVMQMERQLASEAAALGCDWTIILQNDWQSIRGIPLPLIGFCDGRRDIYCLRLYGRFKNEADRPAGDRHKGKDGRPANWRPLDGAPESTEIGDIHWGSPPAATRTDILVWLLKDAARDRDARERSGLIDTLTARPTNRVMVHFGTERTPAFKS